MRDMNKDQLRKTVDYRVFYYIGIVWVPVGFVFMMAVNLVIGIALLGMGISYVAIGLANKDKWKKENKNE